MAKKDFTKNNPALAFITTGEEEEKAETTAKETTETAPKKEAEKKAPAKKTTARKSTAKKTTTKKTAKPTDKVIVTGKAPEGYKINPLYVELKSKRVNLLIQPSVYDRIQKMTKKTKLSMNEIINQSIIEKLEREGF